MIAIERALPSWGFALAALARHENRRYVHLICPPSAIQGRFLKVGKSVRAAPILDLRLGRLWEERRASAGGLSCREIFQSYLRVASPSLFLFSRHDQALDQRIHYGAVRHGQRMCTVAHDGAVVTEASPHHHARHDIQTKVRSPFSDVARCCEAQAAAVSHGLSTTSNCRGRVDAVIRLRVVVVNRFE